MDVIIDALPVIINLLIIVFLFMMIMITYKTLKTMTRVEKLVNELEKKAASVNEIFNLIAKVNGKLTLVSDKIFDVVWNKILSAVSNKFNKKEDKDEK